MWPYVLAAGSVLLNAEAKKKAGKAEEAAGREDLTNALVAGAFREKGIAEKRDRALSSMRARAGRSGVEIAGSPLQVLMYAAGQAERDLVISRFITERNANAARARAKGGAAIQDSADMEAIFNLGSLGFGYAKQSGLGYKKPGLDPDAEFMSNLPEGFWGP